MRMGRGDEQSERTRQSSSTGVDIFFSLIFSYFWRFVAACVESESESESESERLASSE